MLIQIKSQWYMELFQTSLCTSMNPIRQRNGRERNLDWIQKRCLLLVVVWACPLERVQIFSSKWAIFCANEAVMTFIFTGLVDLKTLKVTRYTEPGRII